MNKLSQRLDDLIGRINGEYEVSSSLSSRLSRASVSNPEGWSLLYPELVEAGFSRDLLLEQRDYIQQWLMNAFLAGRIDAVSEEGETSTINGQLVQQGARSTVNDGDDHIGGGQEVRTAPNRSSVLSQESLQATRRKAVPPRPESGASPQNKSSKGWAQSLTTKIKYVTLSPDEALRKAVYNGDASTVRKILSKGQINTQPSSWAHMLESAIRSDNIEVLSNLVCLGSFEDRQDILGKSVNLAVSQKNVAATVLLLEYEAPFSGKAIIRAMVFLPESAVKMLFAKTDVDLYHDEFAHFFLYNAAKYGHESIFRSLVEQYGGINAPVNETTPFHMACQSGNMKSIQLALELGGNVTITDGRGNRPLHALVIGDEDENFSIGANLQLLMKNGASLHEKSQTGQTALHLAAKCAHINAMEALMHMGLPPNTLDAVGNSPLHAACSPEWVKRSVEEYVPLYLKLGGKFVRELFPPSLTEFWGRLIDPREEIHRTAKCEEAVRLMLRYGASVNARGKENITALHLAASCARIGAMNALIEYGADPHAIDTWSWTALHFAVVSGSQKAVDLLIPYDINREGSVSVRILGDHIETMDIEDLVVIIGRGGAFRENLRLKKDPDTNKNRSN